MLTILPYPLVQGVVHRIERDNADLAGLNVIISAGGDADSAAVADDGTFAFRSPLAVRDTVDLIYRYPDKQSANHFPMIFEGVDSTSLRESQSPVLVPVEHSMACGTYAGQVVEVSMAKAFQRVPTEGSWGSFYRQQNQYIWAKEDLPVPVAFDTANSDQPIAPEDSTAFWQGVEELEQALCLDMYKPAPIDSTTDSTGVRIRKVSHVSRGAANGTAWSGSSGFLEGGVAQFEPRSRTRWDVHVLHEMIHVWGHGHTCSWPSMMVNSNCHDTSNFRSTVTAQDAVRADLYRQVILTEHKHGLSPAGRSASLLAAWRGEEAFW